MSQTNDLYVIYDAEQDAATAKSKPTKLSNNKDRYDQYAHDPYVKEDSVVKTLEKMEGVKVTLDKSTETIVGTGNKTLVATISPSEMGPATWTSSDSTVATVNQSGKVTGVKAGEVVITASVGKAFATCTVTITE